MNKKDLPFLCAVATQKVDEEKKLKYWRKRKRKKEKIIISLLSLFCWGGKEEEKEKEKIKMIREKKGTLFYSVFFLLINKLYFRN